MGEAGMDDAEQRRLWATARQYASVKSDSMAVALHRMTGLPLGLWSGCYMADGKVAWEHSLACVIVDSDKEAFIDAFGLEPAMPENLLFSADVVEVQLRQVDEQDVFGAFLASGINEESVAEAMAFAERFPPLRAAYEPYRQLAEIGRPVPR